MHVNLPEKLYYTIGEISEAFDVNASLIRYWEKEFDFLNPMIHHLVKEKGYTLEGAKEQIKLSNKNFEIIKSLEKIKTILINIKNEI